MHEGLHGTSISGDGRTFSVAFGGGTHFFELGGASGEARVWDGPVAEAPPKAVPDLKNVNVPARASVSVAPDGSAAALLQDGDASVVSLPDGTERLHFHRKDTFGSATFLSDRTLLLTIVPRPFSAEAGVLANLITVLGSLTSAMDVTVSPECRTLHIDVNRGLMLRELAGCHHPAASDDSSRVLLVEPSGAHVWDLARGLQLADLTAETEARPVDAALSHDGAIVAAAGEDGALRIWRVADGSLRATVFFLPGKHAAIARLGAAAAHLYGNVALARDALVCRVGARVLPVDECAERFHL
jgi:hypothetical protein